MADKVLGIERRAQSKAIGMRGARFNVTGVWAAVVVMLLACVAVGVGICVLSWWLIGVGLAVLVAGGGLAWASGITNDTH